MMNWISVYHFTRTIYLLVIVFSSITQYSGRIAIISTKCFVSYNYWNNGSMDSWTTADGYQIAQFYFEIANRKEMHWYDIEVKIRSLLVVLFFVALFKCHVDSILNSHFNQTIQNSQLNVYRNNRNVILMSSDIELCLI